MHRGKLILLIFLVQNILCSNAQGIKEKLASIPGITISDVPGMQPGRYEIFIEQPLDHNNPSGGKFKQRLVIDFKSEDSLTVMDTDGYGISYSLDPAYQNELAALLNANLAIIEHRFFGGSVPDSLDYTFLTTAQAAEDVHYIRTLLSPVFGNNWISTGISKGGQAALAHKIRYPEDASFTIVYGTAVKKSLFETKIDSMLDELSKTECGSRLALYQDYIMRHKHELLPEMNDFIRKSGINFGKLDHETVLDYMILELPFSFWQGGHDCTRIPLLTDDPFSKFKFLTSVISPAFYSAKTLKRLEPSFYMSYHELGFYEYNTKKFKGFLKQKTYSNRNFAPDKLKSFDRTYLEKLSAFLKTDSAKSVIFIYGEHDPWASMQETGIAHKLVVKNGSHKSRIADLSQQQLEYLNRLLKQAIK